MFFNEPFIESSVALYATQTLLKMHVLVEVACVRRLKTLCIEFNM